MDDLSFEESELEYKYLKAILEGGFGKRPENVLIYATSNRRHLIRESFRDKTETDEELHSRDTVEEKLSLSARFGEKIYYGSPDKKEFNGIVLSLAKKHGIDMDEKGKYVGTLTRRYVRKKRNTVYNLFTGSKIIWRAYGKGRHKIFCGY